MTDHATFLAAIIARPDDDLPRLIYADWLEETAGKGVQCPKCKGCCYELTSDKHGYMDYWMTCRTCHGTGTVSNGHAERAAFIRTQVELARLNSACATAAKPLETDVVGSAAVRVRHVCGGQSHYCGPSADGIFHAGCRVDALRRREREALRRYRDRWALEVLPVGLRILDHGVDITFRRGFVDEIACSWPDWRHHAKAVRAATPLRRVRLTTWPDQSLLSPEIRSSLLRTDTCKSYLYHGIEFELPQNERAIAGERIDAGQLVTRREDGTYVPARSTPQFP